LIDSVINMSTSYLSFIDYVINMSTSYLRFAFIEAFPELFSIQNLNLFTDFSATQIA